MRMVLLPLTMVCCLIFSLGAEQIEKSNLKRLDGTADLELTSDFRFTISPNDQWLVFFWRGILSTIDDQPQPDVHHLRVLNLCSGEVHAFTLGENQFANWMGESAETSWAPDSSMCVLPPPPQKDRRVVIKFAEGEKPAVSFLPHPHQPRKSGAPAQEQFKMPEHFMCSDCFRHTNDIELFKKHIPKEYLLVGDDTANEGAFQIVSPDGKKVYYQKGPQGRLPAEDSLKTTLYEIDVDTGKERSLVTHEGECPRIGELRPSPDGKKLAYQVTTGCGFISTPKIYVLNLATGQAQDLALGSGSMHWTSTSDKLYFFRKWVGESQGDYLWVAEFGKPDPPPKQP